eukprot:gnl/MRDRNA2_/MRDRNA2_15462_c0_seq1.p1 gnl/MRDRNA2_/MRDRNA2_15462_c0~~gnl/MRDRNA2_/MRDRNA2_15462_c0_seq1.p1  ORF type:complete len:349 (+),score=47.96 gnl/MRDRNA2_/MRDRNA2_15462_c0_seq1:91-1137(+)
MGFFIRDRGNCCIGWLALVVATVWMSQTLAGVLTVTRFPNMHDKLVDKLSSRKLVSRDLDSVMLEKPDHIAIPHKIPQQVEHHMLMRRGVRMNTFNFILPRPSLASGTFCPIKFEGEFIDMVDKDVFQVSINGKDMTLKEKVPSGGKPAWQGSAKLDQKTCSAIVDFSELSPITPSLTATFWTSSADTGGVTAERAEFEFTDPTGKLAPPDFPLNRWVQRVANGQTKSESCPADVQFLSQDMRNGDRKLIVIRDGSMLIAPFSPRPGKSYTPPWVATAPVDPKSCSAIIDLKVPGNPYPPPVPLKATVLRSRSSIRKLNEIEFTDPSGTLSEKDYPLNQYVELQVTQL